MRLHYAKHHKHSDIAEVMAEGVHSDRGAREVDRYPCDKSVSIMSKSSLCSQSISSWLEILRKEEHAGRRWSMKRTQDTHERQTLPNYDSRFMRM